MVRLIIGRAGSGKTSYIMKQIKQSLQKEGRKVMLLVPEQFTLQAERDLMESLNLPGIMQLEVLSFNRLGQRILNELGGLKSTILNDYGKNMVIRRAIQENNSELLIYRDCTRQSGFITEMNKMISGLKQQCIYPADLKKMLDKISDKPTIQCKLHDIALIYDSFNRLLSGKYIDSDDYINLLIDNLSRSKLLNEAEIWIDHFSSFSTQTIRLIEQLMDIAEVGISITMDPVKRNDHDLFSLSKRYFDYFCQSALNKGIKPEIIKISRPGNRRHRSEEFLFLEEQVYAYPYQQYPKEVSNLQIFAAANLNHEIQNMALKVLSLARERGFRWKEIAIICHDLDTYGSLIRRELQACGIPFFMDRKRSLSGNPIVEIVLSSLEVIESGFEIEPVLRLIKTGFTDLSNKDAERLENYVFRYGIRGERWKTDFNQGDELLLRDMNGCRQILIEPLLILEKRLRSGKTAGDLTRALYEYLQKQKVPQKCGEWIQELNSQGLYDLVMENAQLWNILMDLFDQLVEILGDQEMSLKDYLKVVEAGLSSVEIGVIPTTIDQVLVGNIERSKSHNIRALLMIGVNDGIIPSAKNNEILMSEEEIQIINTNGTEIWLNWETKSIEESFYIYNILAKPTDLLYVSYSLVDSEGKALRPSLLIDRFTQLFPGIKVETDIVPNRLNELNLVSTPSSTYRVLIERLRLRCDGNNIEDFWWDIYDWYSSQDYWRKQLETVIEGLFYQNQQNRIRSDYAQRLYDIPLFISASRLETYAGCPFSHYIKYGLKPEEQKLYEVNAPDMGEFLHNSILAFSRMLDDTGCPWEQATSDDCEQLVDRMMEELIPSFGNGVLLSSYRNRYLGQRLKRISQKALQVLTEHLKQGRFIPVGHELPFRQGSIIPPIEVILNNGQVAYIEGRIDRVDILESDDKAYVKIIDYKSGNKKFSLSNIYFGLDMQLLIYLRAILGSTKIAPKKKLLPGGVFYFKIDDPILGEEPGSLKTVESAPDAKIKMNGLAVDNLEVIRGMDMNIQGHSTIIPVGLSQKGDLYSYSSVIKEGEFYNLLKLVELRARTMCREILSGSTRIEPVKIDNIKQCLYCLYGSICQFDPQFEDNRYKTIRTSNKQDIVDRICSEIGEGDK